MPDSAERKHPTKLSSLFVGLAESFSSDPPPPLKSPTPRSPRSFDDGAVGLGIVAAMVGPAGPPPARSEPIPIVSARPAAKWGKPIPKEESELSESYTCVISNVSGRRVTKRVYFSGDRQGEPGEFCEPVQPAGSAPPPPVADFLSNCYLCQTVLHGLDIFMYRGDRAFCSVECRYQQILSDEWMEKCGSEAMKQPFDCSVSPCSAVPLLFATGVAAA